MLYDFFTHATSPTIDMSCLLLTKNRTTHINGDRYGDCWILNLPVPVHLGLDENEWLLWAVLSPFKVINFALIVLDCSRSSCIQYATMLVLVD